MYKTILNLKDRLQNNEETPRAMIREGTLIMMLTNAISPVVWRLDMRHVNSSALEIRRNQEGEFDLVLKTPKADLNKIASFDDRAQAIKALNAVMKAIEQAPIIPKGREIVPINSPAPSVSSGSSGTILMPRHKKSRPILAGFIGACLVVLLLILVSLLLPVPANGPLPNGERSSISSSGGAGQALSADDFLNQRTAP